MKRYFLIFLVLVVLFSACAVNTEKLRTTTGVLGGIVGTFQLSSGIEGKMLTWKYFRDPTKWYEEAVAPAVWPIYPADKVSKEMIGHKVRITYRIQETVPVAAGQEGVLLIHVEKIDIL